MIYGIYRHGGKQCDQNCRSGDPDRFFRSFLLHGARFLFVASRLAGLSLLYNIIKEKCNKIFDKREKRYYNIPVIPTCQVGIKGKDDKKRGKHENIF